MMAERAKAKKLVETALERLAESVENKKSPAEVKVRRTGVVQHITEYRDKLNPRETAKYLTQMGEIVRKGGYQLD
ncbi:hypothetical protein A3K62_02525 [Candidatus Pacearchaeota archaeon RBG_16_35_8]|nr:MAG: hypothetical protein A3K62_02525 [Candidatus Pacearchaeota archaeon RBG_16_35_8]